MIKDSIATHQLQKAIEFPIVNQDEKRNSIVIESDSRPKFFNENHLFKVMNFTNK